MKRKVYYCVFTVFGALLGFFIHMLIEIVYIPLLIDDFSRYGLGLSWREWENVHKLGVIFLTLGLGIWGYYMGRKCWQYLYVEQRHIKRWGIKLKKDF